MTLAESDKDKTYRWRQLQALSSICFNISNNRPDDVFPVETLCIVKEIRPNEVRFKYTGYGSIVDDFEKSKCLATHVDRRWYYKAKMPHVISRTPGPGKPPKKRGRKPAGWKPEDAQPRNQPDADTADLENHVVAEQTEQANTNSMGDAWDVLTSQSEWPTFDNIQDQLPAITGDKGADSDGTVDMEFPAGAQSDDDDDITDREPITIEPKPSENTSEESDSGIVEKEPAYKPRVSGRLNPIILSVDGSVMEDLVSGTPVKEEVKKEEESEQLFYAPQPNEQEVLLSAAEKSLVERKQRIDAKYKPRRRGRPKGSKTTKAEGGSEGQGEQQSKAKGTDKQIIKCLPRTADREKEGSEDEQKKEEEVDEEDGQKVEERVDDGEKKERGKKRRKKRGVKKEKKQQEPKDDRVVRRRNRLNLDEHPCELCPVCERKVPMVNLATHLHMHEVKRKRSANMKYCNNCHKFVEGSVYKEHKAKHVQDNIAGMQCEKCGEVCRRQRYKSHFVRCIGPPPYICFPCGKYYERPDRYIFHCRSLHNWDPPEVFDKKFRETDVGQKYLAEKERLAELKAKEVMGDCDSSDIEEEVQNIKEELYPSPPKKQQEYLCNKCGAKRNSRAALQDHMVSHIETRDFKCDDCEKTFKTLKALNVHAKYTLMHGNAAKHMCRYCGKCFVLQSQLSTHEKRMHEESAAKVPLPRMMCPHCGKMVLKRNIQVHLKTHSEDRPFPCDVCGMRFKFMDILKRHLILHTGTRNFHCELCGKSFAQSATLYKHKLTHKTKFPPGTGPGPRGGKRQTHHTNIQLPGQEGKPQEQQQQPQQPSPHKLEQMSVQQQPVDLHRSPPHHSQGHSTATPTNLTTSGHSGGQIQQQQQHVGLPPGTHLTIPLLTQLTTAGGDTDTGLHTQGIPSGSVGIPSVSGGIPAVSGIATMTGGIPTMTGGIPTMGGGIPTMSGGIPLGVPIGIPLNMMGQDMQQYYTLS